jgi:hypothetical protein
MARIIRNIAPAALVALLAGTAAAQFVAEAAQPAQPGHVSVQTIVTETNGSRSELRLENDQVVKVVLDGKTISLDRVQRNGSEVIVLGPAGERLHVFRLVSPSAAPVAPVVIGRSVTPVAPVPPAAPSSRELTISTIDLVQPPVMLGINLSSPGEQLRAHLGIGENPAILIDRVIEGLPAAKAGLKQHDVIISINGSESASSETLSETLAAAKPGDTIDLAIKRGGETVQIKATLEAYDAARLGTEMIGVPAAPGTPGQWTARSDDGKTRVWIQGEPHEMKFDFEIDSPEWRGMAERFQQKAAEAMRDAERQLLELRGDRLFVRPAEQMEQEMRAMEQALRERGPAVESHLEQRLEAMEQRFSALEDRMAAQIDQMGGRMERLADLLDRLADRLERAVEKGEEE